MNIKGFIGALIGSILFSLPWVLLYVYGGYMLSLFAAIIGTGGLIFYKLFGAKVSKRTPTIILITSLISITIAIFVLIPCFLLLKEGYGFDLEMFKKLYNSNNFVNGIIKDYIISIIFTLLGISGILRNINNEIYNINDNEDILTKSYEEQIKILKEIFIKYNSFNKNNAIPKSVILSNLKYKNNFIFLKNMEKRGIIVNNFNKYYFDEEAINNEKKGKKNYIKQTIKVFFITSFITLIVLFGFILLMPSNEELKDYNYKNITIKLPENLEKQNETDTYEYYINSEMSVLLQQITLENNITLENFVKYYENEHSEKYEIYDKKETIYDGIKGYKIKMNDNKYHDIVYIQYDNNKVYLIIFEKYNVKDNSFDNKTEEYMKTVKFK